MLASIGHIRHTGRVMLLGATGYVVALASLAYCPLYWLAVPVLIGMGLAEVTVGSLRTTVLQLRSRRELLGRVMSLHAISTRGLGPLGAFEAGTIAQFIGVRSALGIGAALCLAAVIFVTLRVPELLSLQTEPHPADEAFPARGRGRSAL